MKPPKEPEAFKWPRMYATFRPGSPYYCRLRIIEPCGKSTWFDDFNGDKLGTPCWYHEGMTAHEAVRALKEYDSRVVYIGGDKMKSPNTNSIYGRCLKCPNLTQHYSQVCPECRKIMGVKNRYRRRVKR